MKVPMYCIVAKAVEGTMLFKAELCVADYQKKEYTLVTEGVITTVELSDTPHSAIGHLVRLNSTFDAFKCCAHLLSRATSAEEFGQLGKDIASMGDNNRPFAVHICGNIGLEEELVILTQS